MCEDEAIGSMCVCVCVYVYLHVGVFVYVCVCVRVVCFKMLKVTHAHTHQLFDEHNAHYYCLSTLFLVWRFGPCSDHGLPLPGVSIKLKFDEVGVSVLRPTPSNPGGPMGCFFV